MLKIGDKVKYHPHPIVIPIEFKIQKFKKNNKGIEMACSNQWGCFPVKSLIKQ